MLTTEICLFGGEAMTLTSVNEWDEADGMYLGLC